MGKIRFAVLGLGNIADVHVKAINSITEAELVAVCDADKERVLKYSKKYGVKGYLSYEEMLGDENIDAVTIATPSSMHKNQSLMALEKNKHVIVEKPMALTSEDAKQVCEAAKKSKKVFSVFFQIRFSEDIKKLKRIIEEEKLGKLIFCDLYMKYWREPSYYKESSWRGTFAMDGGGALMNQGIHGIDIMQYLFGTPKLFSAKVKTLIHDIETEDTAVAILEYPCGALGVIEAATSAKPGFNRRIEINGTRGYAFFSESSIEKLYIDGEMIIDRKIETSAGTASNPTEMGYENHARQIENFIRNIKGEEKLVSSAEDGFLAVDFIEKIYKKSNEI